MTERFIELYIPQAEKEKISQILEKNGGTILGISSHERELINIEALINAESSDTIMDILEKHLLYKEGFRIIVFPVAASLPRIKKKIQDELDLKKKKKSPFTIGSTIGREELYQEIDKMLNISSYYIAMVVLSAIVAGIGLIKNNTAVIIGAMVIAPLLGPNVALSFSAALGDYELLKRSVINGLAGFAAAFIIGFFWGLFGSIDPNLSEIVSRTEIGLGDLVLAIVSGAAGVLSITVGSSSSLVGVMVAVALMPPLITCGLLAGNGNYHLAFGAFLVFTANIICVNLAGIITFLIQGIRPKTWWETQKAKKAAKVLLILWFVLLAALIVIIKTK